ncbi:hypothetical protein GNP10_14640 [Escherichia coli]|nr:hypothetical protein [Escherichia coli]
MRGPEMSFALNVGHRFLRVPPQALSVAQTRFAFISLCAQPDCSRRPPGNVGTVLINAWLPHDLITMVIDVSQTDGCVVVTPHQACFA